MFNTSFSNKIQLKIKNIFFILLDQTQFNAFLALNRISTTGTSTVHELITASCKQLTVGPPVVLANL